MAAGHESDVQVKYGHRAAFAAPSVGDTEEEGGARDRENREAGAKVVYMRSTSTDTHL